VQMLTTNTLDSRIKKKKKRTLPWCYHDPTHSVMTTYSTSGLFA